MNHEVWMDSPDLGRRRRLADIARVEAELRLGGDDNQAGPDIEKYLALFREAMNRRAGTTRYADLSIGYDWCAAFVYYCCLQAGYRFLPEPSSHINGSLAAVKIWNEWALLQKEGAFLLGQNELPQPGDIVLFDSLLVDIPLDHMGIVIGVEQDAIVTAEGNVANRAGIFRRQLGVHIHGFVRLGKYER